MPEAEEIITYAIKGHCYEATMDAMERCHCPWCGAQPVLLSYFFGERSSGWYYDCGTVITYSDCLNNAKNNIYVTISRSSECILMSEPDDSDVI